MVCGLSPRYESDLTETIRFHMLIGYCRKPKVEVLKLEWDRLQNENARLRSERASSRAEAIDLNNDLMQIRTRISSFLDEYRVNTPSRGGIELDVVFDAYSKLEQRHKDLEDRKRVADENLQAQKKRSQQLERTIWQKESEFEEKIREKENISTAKLSSKEKEIKDLEKSLIMGGDYYQPEPDSKLTVHFDKLQRKVRSFAEATRPARQVSQQAFAEDLKRKFEQSIAISDLKHFSEEALWAILIEKVFSTPFRVFGKYGENLAHTWLNFFPEGKFQELFGRPESTSPSQHPRVNIQLTIYSGQAVEGSAAIWPAPNSFSERWRSLTVGNLAAAVRGQRSGRDAQEIQSSYNSNRNDLIESLRRTHEIDDTLEIGNLPEKITDLACEIAMTCGTERYRIQLAIPQKSTLITKEDIRDRYMHVRNLKSYENAVHVSVGMVISPGLEKMGVGDGNAQYFDGSFRILFPAHVWSFS
jgi:hypothetical protein